MVRVVVPRGMREKRGGILPEDYPHPGETRAWTCLRRTPAVKAEMMAEAPQRDQEERRGRASPPPVKVVVDDRPERRKGAGQA